MMKFSEIAAKYFDDAHVLELIMRQKRCPSGTAKMTAQKIGAVMNKSNPDKSPVLRRLYRGIPVSSIRGGGFNAYQQVTFMSPAKAGYPA
jgi:dihydrodipicolinate reductase